MTEETPKQPAPLSPLKAAAEEARLARLRDDEVRQEALRRMEDAGHINPPRHFG